LAKDFGALSAGGSCPRGKNAFQTRGHVFTKGIFPPPANFGNLKAQLLLLKKIVGIPQGGLISARGTAEHAYSLAKFSGHVKLAK
jgi:hypothetical protein